MTFARSVPVPFWQCSVENGPSGRPKKKIWRSITYAVILSYHTLLWYERQLELFSEDHLVVGTEYRAYLFISIFMAEWWNRGNFGSERFCPGARRLRGAFRCCSAALLGGRRQYGACLIREWEDLNPPGLGPPQPKIAWKDLKIRLPRLCNVHSSPSLWHMLFLLSTLTCSHLPLPCLFVFLSAFMFPWTLPPSFNLFLSLASFM